MALKNNEYTGGENSVINRILLAKSTFDILGLDRRNINRKALRKKYLCLALQVHPDKNPDPTADSAFRKLHDAYEQLLKSVGATENHAAFDSCLPGLRKAGSSSTAPSSSKFSQPPSEPKKKRVRPYSEIMEEWEEAELQFKKENDIKWEQYKSKRKRPSPNIPERDFNDLTDDFLEGIDSRSSSWRDFQNINKESDSEKFPSQEGSIPSVHTTIDASNNKNGQNLPEDSSSHRISHICWICRRRFKTDELLKFHEVMSTLHESFHSVKFEVSHQFPQSRFGLFSANLQNHTNHYDLRAYLSMSTILTLSMHSIMMIAGQRPHAHTSF
eukprot:gene3325-6580_t